MAKAQVDTMAPPSVSTGTEAPVRKIDSNTLRQLGGELSQTFGQYASDRRLVELKWMRNLRQYLGVYDPEIDRELGQGRSRAYPRVTRVKCISVLSRIMNLMYPGNERNWELNASPSPEMDPQDIALAIQELVKERETSGVPTEPSMDMLDAAVQKLADKRAAELSRIIDDQLQELGGNQSLDVIALDRKVSQSAIMYGLGVLEGPYVREVRTTQWVAVGVDNYEPQERTIYKPQFDFLSVWDFYPDMSSRELPGEAYFIRKVMGKSQLRKLADRKDFFSDQIKKYLSTNGQGNYKPREFETELRAMGTKAHVNDQPRTDPQGKYEVLIYKGPISGSRLANMGVTVAEDKLSDDIESEIWMVDQHIIKADMNPWRRMGVEVDTVHCFVFDEDDTSPVGNGLPNVMRDSQMSVCAATRMMLDNASVTCGPNLEVNTSLMRMDQDLTAIEAYKIWYRDDDGITAQFPAVRRVEVDGHLEELKGICEMFMLFADMETFVGPATGGDVQKAPSEPMRTAAGASMLRGDAALPFKDIIRNFDTFKQSVILSLVQFNRKFNPTLAPAGDYNVIARGATSLIAKEVRGMQLDILAQSLTDEERDHIDERKFVEQRFAVRDMSSLLVPEEEAQRRKDARGQMQAMMAELTKRLQLAEERDTLSNAFKNIAQGQKNLASVDAQNTNNALAILEFGSRDDEDGSAKKSAGAR